MRWWTVCGNIVACLLVWSLIDRLKLSIAFVGCDCVLIRVVSQHDGETFTHRLASLTKCTFSAVVVIEQGLITPTVNSTALRYKSLTPLATFGLNLKQSAIYHVDGDPILHVCSMFFICMELYGWSGDNNMHMYAHTLIRYFFLRLVDVFLREFKYWDIRNWVQYRSSVHAVGLASCCVKRQHRSAALASKFSGIPEIEEIFLPKLAKSWWADALEGTRFRQRWVPRGAYHRCCRTFHFYCSNTCLMGGPSDVGFSLRARAALKSVWARVPCQDTGPLTDL